MGKIPEQGESFAYGDFTFNIEQISDNRIHKVRVTQSASVSG